MRITKKFSVKKFHTKKTPEERLVTVCYQGAQIVVVLMDGKHTHEVYRIIEPIKRCAPK